MGRFEERFIEVRRVRVLSDLMSGSWEGS